MCGRFENNVREEWMIEKFASFDISIIFNTKTDERKYENIAPTNSILTLVGKDEEVLGNIDKWGIKFSDKSPLIFNSRIETVIAKPFWKMLFDRNRCIVPMTAFYEWKKENNKKVPYKVFLKDEEFFFVPGLYNIDKEGKKTISLITTEPNDFMKSIHHRMPVILKIEDAIAFLSDDAENNFQRCIPYKDSANMNLERVNI